jgi:hypothetical protein
VTVAAVALSVLSIPATASAESPANDARGNPITVTPPVTVSGATKESTIEADEPPMCQGLRGSVWYQFQGVNAEPMLVRLHAAGDLDGTVEIFQRTRSQVASVACDATDSDGNAAVRFTPVKGGTYLIRVGQRFNSAPGDFTLEVFTPEAPPRGPGAALARQGVRAAAHQ